MRESALRAVQRSASQQGEHIDFKFQLVNTGCHVSLTCCGESQGKWKSHRVKPLDEAGPIKKLRLCTEHRGEDPSTAVGCLPLPSRGLRRPQYLYQQRNQGKSKFRKSP